MDDNQDDGNFNNDEKDTGQCRIECEGNQRYLVPVLYTAQTILMHRGNWFELVVGRNCKFRFLKFNGRGSIFKGLMDIFYLIIQGRIGQKLAFFPGNFAIKTSTGDNTLRFQTV